MQTFNWQQAVSLASKVAYVNCQVYSNAHITHYSILYFVQSILIYLEGAAYNCMQRTSTHNSYTFSEEKII